MENKLVLKDGTEIIDALVALNGNELTIIINGGNIQEAFDVFGNHEKTEEMTYYSGFYKNVYDGYTKLTGVRYLYEDSSIQINMKGTKEAIHHINYTIPDELLPEGMREEIKNA